MKHEEIAECMDNIAAEYGKLANLFRAASNTGGNGRAKGGADGDEPAPSSRSRSKSKPAASKKAAAQEDLTIDEVREKLKELVDAKGKESMVEALESVGAGKLADVDESQYGELVAEAQRRIDEEEPDEAPAPKTRSRSKKAKGPTADDLLEKFKELIDADKAKAKSVLKGLGVAKISEVDDDDVADAMKAVEAALEGDEEDDLL